MRMASNWCRTQTQPTIGHMAKLHLAASQLHATKPCELNDPSPRMHAVFENPARPVDGLFHLPKAPGLGLQVNEAELAKRRVPIARGEAMNAVVAAVSRSAKH